jgi:hypothetical protein
MLVAIGYAIAIYTSKSWQSVALPNLHKHLNQAPPVVSSSVSDWCMSQRNETRAFYDALLFVRIKATITNKQETGSHGESAELVG